MDLEFLRNDVMSTIQRLTAIVREFKARHGIDAADHHIAATIHIMNEHKVDADMAMDRTSLEPNDHGIDAWYISADSQKLYIYQSKFSESTSYSLKGIADLNRANDWITSLICDGKRPESPSNTALRNLTSEPGVSLDRVTEVEYTLQCLCPEQVEDSEEWKALYKTFEKGRLNRFLETRGGGVDLRVVRHNFSKSIARQHKRYRVETFQQTELHLRNGTYLRLAYIPISSLIRLYRERGSNLFEKNVRMSLMSFKDASNRVAHPMEATFRQIANGELPPEIFAFYHLGITLWAASEENATGDALNLESPAVVNGCQTINIADRFLRTIETENWSRECIDRFTKIRLVAKIVVGSSDEELREITNCNNRQNPIDEWQLYSNDEIHHHIESELRNLGIFYERQKGKLKSISKETEILRDYPNTNDAAINIPELASVIALCQGDMQRSAKFSEIFTDKKIHDLVFSEGVVRDISHTVLLTNLNKAARRALSKLLRENERANRYRHLIDKPSTRVHFWRLALLYGTQKMDQSLKKKFSHRLNRMAPPTLVDELMVFYESILGKVLKEYCRYERESDSELSGRAKERLFKEIAVAKGLQANGLPFRREGIRPVKGAA